MITLINIFLTIFLFIFSVGVAWAITWVVKLMLIARTLTSLDKSDDLSELKTN